MSDGEIISNMKSCTTYGENLSVEDFAESIAEYVKDEKRLQRKSRTVQQSLLNSFKRKKVSYGDT